MGDLAPPPTPPRDKTCWVPLPPPPPQKSKSSNTFSRNSANGADKISAAELDAIMSDHGYNTTDEELQKIDSDGDGFIDFG
ncbi:hypothetical protein Ddye_012858 [Dipteronia dyeriana]|uniref:EF-hand domain-containing protein n=1 Tax=Dipteronia dyeriana TaxID=168575 RepID=A0AAD9X5C7_9ROSI|nr:hypothetical protein Ddye_012858 [Dipteronia dyeriana]